MSVYRYVAIFLLLDDAYHCFTDVNHRKCLCVVHCLNDVTSTECENTWSDQN